MSSIPSISNLTLLYEMLAGVNSNIKRHLDKKLSQGDSYEQLEKQKIELIKRIAQLEAAKNIMTPEKN